MDGSIGITTKMLSLKSPRMALEEYGYDVQESCFKKGNISFNYYLSRDGTVNINVWKDEVIVSRITKAQFINVLIVTDCVILTSLNCKVTIDVD